MTNPPPSRAKILNMWSYTSTSQNGAQAKGQLHILPQFYL